VTSGRRALALVVCGGTLALGAARRADGQQPPVPARPDTVRAEPAPPSPVPADTSAVRERGDSVRPVSPITPGGAFLRSLVLPGWGQARLGRNVTGGLFLLFEGMAGAMVWKCQWQLEWARTRGKFVDAHRQEREDWIVLLAFNHIMAAAEAYVSALLYDYPVALKARRLPDGATGIGVSVPLR